MPVLGARPPPSHGHDAPGTVVVPVTAGSISGALAGPSRSMTVRAGSGSGVAGHGTGGSRTWSRPPALVLGGGSGSGHSFNHERAGSSAAQVHSPQGHGTHGYVAAGARSRLARSSTTDRKRVGVGGGAPVMVSVGGLAGGPGGAGARGSSGELSAHGTEGHVSGGGV